MRIKENPLPGIWNALMSFGFVGDLPDLEEANGGMKAVEDGQGHGDMRDDCPHPHTEEVHMSGPEHSSSFDQGVHKPDGDVCYQKKGDDFASWLPPLLVAALAPPMAGIQDEEGLQ